MIVIIVIIGITSWMYLARIVRANFLSLKEREFVLAAHTTGTSNASIIFQHILPNSIAPIVVSATLGCCECHHLRSVYQFLGFRRPAAYGNLGQYARRRL